MSRSAKVTLDWADGTYDFRLGWGEIAALQEACDAGPFVILGRLEGGAWKVADISHVIRLGLVGGGMTPPAALQKVRAYVEARPPMENWLFANTILKAGVFGAPEENVEKKSDAPDREESASTISPTEKSGSEPSTVTSAD